ncbi:MAG: pro-sigmaK processing inhibitor BofA family protein [Oscillospiraceae bacterium]|nr:pro-sigmaK processing inhibitor BofA family protein [Oscillospiraceae bacterium]
MENFAALLIPALLGVMLLRLLLLPMKWGIRVALHAGCGFFCLWLLNTVAFATGVYLPINAVTVLISGTLGLPGVALLTLLEIL